MPTSASPPISSLATLRALIEPRRLVPVVLVGAGLVATELWATRHPGSALWLAGFVVLFAATMPVAWRWVAAAPSPARGAAYVGWSVALVALACWGPVALLGQEPYVAHPPAAAAILTLVMIAGWILGRDIELTTDLAQLSEQRTVLAREVEDARLLAIRQHLDPHFLFNTLGAIAEWCREDPLVAERALLELSAMLRTLFDGIREPEWPLARELEVLTALHRLYELRDDERYRLETSLESVETAVPPLVLLPLFENALTHGDGPIALSVERGGDSVVVTIWSAGAYAGRRDGGSGIATVERRLALAYGEAASVRVASQRRRECEGTMATVRLPSRGQP